MFIAGLATSAPSASAGKITAIGNGVATRDGTIYWCNSKPVVPSTEAIIVGTEGNDVILATGPLVSEVHGLGGNDTICVMTAGATIFGGPGRDYIFSANTPKRERLGPEISTIWGGDGDDVIRGGSAMDNISGGDGSDILRGGGGYDYIWGGPGRDVFDGGDNGSRIAPGATAAGDICVDFDKSMVDMHMNCERWADDPYANPDAMPPVPVEALAGCRICPFSNFR